MNRRKILSWITGIAIVAPVIVSCSQNTVTTSSTVSLNVSAAASLKNVMQEIQSTYTQKPHTKLTYNFASSGSLQQQIEQGAPVDIFISAGQKQMNALEKKGLLLAGTRKGLLGNEVVLIASQNAPKISGFADLKGNQVKQVAIADPKSVPAGQYGQEVLTTLKLFDTLRPKLVFAKDVRQVLSYVETGNADAGIVYTTDAKTSHKVKVVATAPKGSHAPIVYPVAVLKESKNPDAAKEFLKFLSGDQARTKFQQAGFSTVHQ